MYNSINLAECKVLVVYPIALSRLQQPFISEDLFYITTVQEPYLRVISFTPRTLVDMEAVVASLPNGWYPDLLIAKVDGCFHLPPVNVSTLKCHKILMLGDTHHGLEPLQRMITYAQQEQYDFYITDCDRHHLWYYWLAGIRNLYWLPTLLIPSPIPNFQELPYQQKNITNQSFQNKAIFIGNIGIYHPRRQRNLEYLSRQVPDFHYGQMSLEDSFKAYRQANLSLNMSLNGDTNMRNFEIISAGGFLLSERLSDETGINLILEEGKDYEVFSDLQELVDKTRYFLKHSSLSYRQSSYEKYLNIFSPARCISMLQELVQGREISDVFTTKSVKRIQHFSPTQLSLARIQLYELIQNIHIFWEKVTIAVDAQVDFAHAIDFLDLNRVEIIINQQVLPEDVMAYLIDANNLSRVKLTHDFLDESFNIIITSTCDPATLAKLVQKNTLIISTDYNGLTMACGYPDFTGLQWDQNVLSNDFFVVNGNIDAQQLSLIDFIAWHNLPVIDRVELLLEELDFREINLLLCLDWQQSEESISDRLLSVLTPVFISPQVEQIAVVVCIEQVQEETANLLLSTTMMNILMQEGLEIMGEPGLVFVDRTDSLVWSNILPKLQYRLGIVEEKVGEKSEYSPEIANLPLWNPNEL